MMEENPKVPGVTNVLIPYTSYRVERLQHILNWFDKYLQGADIKLYDPQ